MWSKEITQRPSLEQINSVLKELKSLWNTKAQCTVATTTQTYDERNSEVPTIKVDFTKSNDCDILSVSNNADKYNLDATTVGESCNINENTTIIDELHPCDKSEAPTVKVNKELATVKTKVEIKIPTKPVASKTYNENADTKSSLMKSAPDLLFESTEAIQFTSDKAIKQKSDKKSIPVKKESSSLGSFFSKLIPQK